jgi:hypothetical protein
LYKLLKILKIHTGNVHTHLFSIIANFCGGMYLGTGIVWKIFYNANKFAAGICRKKLQIHVQIKYTLDLIFVTKTCIITFPAFFKMSMYFWRIYFLWNLYTQSIWNLTWRTNGPHQKFLFYHLCQKTTYLLKSKYSFMNNSLEL